MSDELPEHLQLIEQYQKLIQQQVKRRSRFIYLQPWGKSTMPLSFSFPCMNFHFFIVPLSILKESICDNIQINSVIVTFLLSVVTN